METASNVNSDTDLPKIDSVPNFRLVCTRSSSGNLVGKLLNFGALYRSSKPERIISEELDEFRKLNIKCIIDLRSENEYMTSSGSHDQALHKEYMMCKVLLPKENYRPGDTVKYEVISDRGSQSDAAPRSTALATEQSPSSSTGSKSALTGRKSLSIDWASEKTDAQKCHYLINFFGTHYIMTLFRRLPWHLYLLGILHMLWDLISRNNFKTFSNFFAQRTLNPIGIFGQYVDIIELCQPAICSALKLIADPNNLPALINCAHGKDRTGLITALVLSCMGMAKEYIAEEYAMSSDGLEPIKHLVYADIVEKYHLKTEFCSADAKTMLSLLTYVEDKYRSVEEYLEHIGFSKDEQKMVKENLEAFDYKTSLAGLISHHKLDESRRYRRSFFEEDIDSDCTGEDSELEDKVVFS